jgi:hypothetical protein
VTQDNKIIAGVIVVVLAVGLVWYAVANKDDDISDAGCTIGAAGLVRIATAVKSEGTANEAISLIGSTITGLACKKVVESLYQHEPAVVKVDGQPTTLTLPELKTPAPPPPVNSLGRWLDCYTAYGGIRFLFDACKNGTINPPQ